MAPAARARRARRHAAASSRFRGPSQPSSLEVRMAPVMATGTAAGSVRASRYAVSSIVSVPWVTTMPVTSPLSRDLRDTRRAAPRACPGRDGRPGAWPSSRSGRARSRPAPVRSRRAPRRRGVGTLPPAAGSRCMEMVPPVNRRWIMALGIPQRKRGIAGHPDPGRHPLRRSLAPLGEATTAHPHSTLPPFTFRTSPVTCRARSLHRNRIGPAMSSGGGIRRSGMRAPPPARAPRPRTPGCTCRCPPSPAPRS